MLPEDEPWRKLLFVSRVEIEQRKTHGLSDLVFFNWVCRKQVETGNKPENPIRCEIIIRVIYLFFSLHLVACWTEEIRGIFTKQGQNSKLPLINWSFWLPLLWEYKIIFHFSFFFLRWNKRWIAFCALNPFAKNRKTVHCLMCGHVFCRDYTEIIYTKVVATWFWCLISRYGMISVAVYASWSTFLPCPKQASFIFLYSLFLRGFFLFFIY